MKNQINIQCFYFKYFDSNYKQILFQSLRLTNGVCTHGIHTISWDTTTNVYAVYKKPYVLRATWVVSTKSLAGIHFSYYSKYSDGITN